VAHAHSLIVTTNSSVLSVERDGHVATLWLDSAERRNAMGPDLWRDLPVLMDELSTDRDVRAVVIAAKGPCFTVGLDLKAMGGDLAAGGTGGGASSEADRRQAIYRSVKQLQGSINAVADCPKPVIAAVHGYCIGGGIDLITACDIRLATADAVFSVRETKIAIVADLGTLQRLPGVVAPGHAAELIYTGKDIDASRAREIGLINDVLPDHDTLVKAAGELAGEIAANSPLAVQGSKAVLRAGAGRSVAESLDYVALWNTAFLGSNDLIEAMQAFFEKRPPRFTGT
jgi:enoyl-CoA hydratase